MKTSLCRAVCACLLATAFAGCSIERAQTAAAAQTAMVGMSKADVLACMGVPQAKASEGNVEVWSYTTGNGRIDSLTTMHSSTDSVATGVGQATRVGNTVYAAAAATGNSQTNGYALGTKRNRSCTVNVVMTDARVSRVSYSGPTGGVLTKGEQCAYAVESCVK